jgi:hypothetical protein
MHRPTYWQLSIYVHTYLHVFKTRECNANSICCSFGIAMAGIVLYISNVVDQQQEPAVSQLLGIGFTEKYMPLILFDNKCL